MGAVFIYFSSALPHPHPPKMHKIKAKSSYLILASDKRKTYFSRSSKTGISSNFLTNTSAYVSLHKCSIKTQTPMKVQNFYAGHFSILN
jgi:hypothetical protein